VAEDAGILSPRKKLTSGFSRKNLRFYGKKGEVPELCYSEGFGEHYPEFRKNREDTTQG